MNQERECIRLRRKAGKGRMMKIIADLHTHTIASGHAYSTFMENMANAKEKGLKYLGVSDHAPALDDAPKETYFRNLKVIRKDWGTLQVLHGAELSILNEYGDLDLPPEVLDTLDYAIASLHYPVYPKEKRAYCTDAAIAAMSNPHVFILGHPDDDLMPLDYKAVTRAAKRYQVALEVNNSSLCPGSFREGAAGNYSKMLKLAKSLEVPVIVSSDSHICYDVGNMTRALAILDECKFPKELVVNSSLSRLTGFLADKKKAVASAKGNRLPIAV